MAEKLLSVPDYQFKRERKIKFEMFCLLKETIGLRISKSAERLGTDKAEVGVSAYSIRD